MMMMMISTLLSLDVIQTSSNKRNICIMEKSIISKFLFFKQKYTFCSVDYFVLNNCALSTLSLNTHGNYFLGIYR